MSAQMEKMASSIEIKIDGNHFLEIYRDKPHQLNKMTPANIHSVELCDGEWGKEGSVTRWTFTHDGRMMTVTCITGVAKNSVTYRICEGDLLAAYKTMAAIISVDKEGDKNLVTWTFEYEKKDESIPNADMLIQLGLSITKDINAYNLNK
ncbi:OLC1v1003100C1 [Oldenlandia corymbosa var. corymbosa]|uniref:OLC1v1003100C1 n=1 Tax=Oldenlandia corymbosa var. corymbosa TaxID=529605 RepID=A0AAV1DC75_OLDCO|nr:OLC1v1003100C1 [Oldenlandia corymbosa var. corymbosa]